MKFYQVLFTFLLVINLSVPCQGLFNGLSLQEYVESIVDAAKFQFEGLLSLNDSALNHIWSFFKSKYGRVYSSIEEEKQRLRIFRDHLQYVVDLNLQKLNTFRLELNEFADMTLEEFNSFKKGLIAALGYERSLTNYAMDDDSLRRSLKRLYRNHYHLRRMKRSLYRRKFTDKRFFRDWFYNLFNPDKNRNNTQSQSSNLFDWRQKNVISSIKNQLKCGCCYAFATATVMETLYALKTKSENIIEFSAQQMNDCSGNGNNGCNGGNFPPSVRYLLEQGGYIATEASYPFAGKRQTCQTSGLNKIHLGNIEYGAIPEGNEKSLAEALVNYGPIFIGIDADSRLFMFYKSGVLRINNCPTRRQDMDHAMVIVGYGHDNVLNTPYWIIKNSWGTRWGENGYLRLAKDSGNMCGVASMAYYAKLT